MKKIDISTKKYPNTFALVDDEDYERMNKYKWNPQDHKSGLYAERQIRIKGMRNLKIKMSREIMRYVGGKIVDHKNHDSLDNRKDNLRLCTKSQNQMNKRIQKNNTSGYVGVSFRKELNKWQAYITKDKKRIYLGFHIKKSEAAEAYNKKALELFGEFANPNIIKEVI